VSHERCPFARVDANSPRAAQCPLRPQEPCEPDHVEDDAGDLRPGAVEAPDRVDQVCLVEHGRGHPEHRRGDERDATEPFGGADFAADAANPGRAGAAPVDQDARHHGRESE